MKILSIITGPFLFMAVQVCDWGNGKVNEQTIIKIATKEEPKTLKLKIIGIICAGCSNHVATTIKAFDGIVEQKVEYPRDIATLKYYPTKTSVSDIIKAIEKIGYKAVAISEKTTSKQS